MPYRRRMVGRQQRRRTVSSVLAVLVVLALAGCVRAEYDITVDGETTSVSGEIVFLTESADDGHDCSVWWSEESPFRGSEDATTEATRFVEDDHPGCRFSLTDRTDGLRNSDGSALITRDGDTFRFRVPATSEPSTADPDGGSPQITLALTFPGPVIDGDGGDVDGRTVTFTDLTDLGQGIDVVADAGDTPAPTNPVLVWVVGGIVALGVAGVAAVVVVHARRR
jgi:hypothetical protein